MGLGFLHPTGRYRPGGSAFSSPGCWIHRDMEGFLIRGWELILPGCVGTSALARGAKRSPRAGSMSPSQSATSQRDWGLHTMRGGIDPGDLRFRPRVVGVAKVYGRVSIQGMRTYPCRSALALCTITSQSAIGQWNRCFHTVRGDFDPVDHRFPPQVVGFYKGRKDF